MEGGAFARVRPSRHALLLAGGALPPGSGPPRTTGGPAQSTYMTRTARRARLAHPTATPRASGVLRLAKRRSAARAKCWEGGVGRQGKGSSPPKAREIFGSFLQRARPPQLGLPPELLCARPPCHRVAVCSVRPIIAPARCLHRPMRLRRNLRPSRQPSCLVDTSHSALQVCCGISAPSFCDLSACCGVLQVAITMHGPSGKRRPPPRKDRSGARRMTATPRPPSPAKVRRGLPPIPAGARGHCSIETQRAVPARPA